VYGKLFESTFTGSMVGSGSDVFAVWSYVLANQRKGIIELNPKILATVIGMSEESAAATIAKLCEPDPRSRNKAHEGRRMIREGEYQYIVTGYPIYSKIMSEDERKEYNRVKKQESRARQKSTDVIDRSTKSRMSAHTDADASSDADAKPSTTSSPSAPVEEVVSHYRTKRPRTRPGAKERALITSRLKEGFTVPELKEAIDGCLARPFTNDAGKTFDSLELIVRNSAKVNQYRSQVAASDDAGRVERVKARILEREAAHGSR